MSKNFFFHSLNFQNYRGLKKLSIQNLHRINIIGGLNGVGKSTILDGIMLMMGRNNHYVWARPFLANNVQLPYPNGYDYLFHDYDHSKMVQIYGNSAGGTYRTKISSSSSHEAHLNTTTKPERENNINLSAANSRAVTLELTTGGKLRGDIIILGQNAPDNIFINVKDGGHAFTPNGAYTSSSGFNPVDDAQRYSVLIKERRTEPLYKYLRLLFPDLLQMQLLQEGGTPVMYVEFSDGSMVQSVLLGGGFKMMLSTALMMMTIRDGVFLLDEVDNAIHHSLLADFWSLIARLASDTNGQVFAVTHSRECIGAAVRGISSINKIGDLGYFRLEEKLDETIAIAYTGDELVEALSSDWEMR